MNKIKTMMKLIKKAQYIFQSHTWKHNIAAILFTVIFTTDIFFTLNVNICVNLIVKWLWSNYPSVYNNLDIFSINSDFFLRFNICFRWLLNDAKSYHLIYGFSWAKKHVLFGTCFLYFLTNYISKFSDYKSAKVFFFGAFLGLLASFSL